jgi:hypothetical protein
VSTLLRCILAGVMWLSALIFLTGWNDATASQRMWSAGLAALLLIGSFGVLAPTRFRIALRIIAGATGLGYIAYFVSELVALINGQPQQFRIGQPSALMAGLGLAVFAVPCLVYAIGVERTGILRIFDWTRHLGMADDEHAPASQEQKDRVTLAAMLEAGADLTKETELLFFVYTRTEDNAEHFAAKERIDGWDCEVHAPIQGTIDWLVILKTHAVPSVERISGFTARFRRRELTDGVRFDGWEAAVRK